MLGCMHVKTKQNRPGSAKCLTAEMVSPPAFVFAQPFFSVHGVWKWCFAVRITGAAEWRMRALWGLPVGTCMQMAKWSPDSSRGPLPATCHILSASYPDRSNICLSQGHVQLGNGPVTSIWKVFWPIIRLNQRVTCGSHLVAACWLATLLIRWNSWFRVWTGNTFFAQMLILLRFFHLESSYNK